MMICKLCGSFIEAKFSIASLWQWTPFIADQLCDDCLKQFVKIGPVNCPYCGRKQDNKGICQDCQRWQESTTVTLTNQACYQYNSIMKSYITQYKYQYDYELRYVFQKEFTTFLKATGPSIYISIPVKHQERQFNQVTGLIELNKIKLLPALQIKNEAENKGQAKRNRYQRLTSKQPFELIMDNCTELKGKQIVLIDDIYTTGATLHHAANLLAQFKPSQIIARTLCR